MSGAPVCFVDVETTSLHPTEGEIYEAGLILPGGEEMHWWLPVNLEHADEMALRVGRFHERHPHGNHSPKGSKDRCANVASFAKAFASLTHGTHLAGAVVSFDALRLDRLLRSQGVLPSWEYHLIDVEALAAGYLAAQQVVTAQPPWDSKALTTALGIDLDQFTAHEALEDAKWAKAMYIAVMG